MITDDLFSHRVRGAQPPVGLRGMGAPDTIFFGSGFPEPAAYPTQDIGRLLDAVANDADRSVLSYAYGKGDVRLREAIAARAADGGGLTAEEIVLTNGSAGAIGLVAAAFLEPNDVVVVEAATYPGALKAFRQMGAEIVAAPMDADGLDPHALTTLLARLAAAGRRVKLIYTIPTCQNPTGTTLSLERRREILGLAEHFDALVVEDNTYGEIRFEAAPATFIALDPTRTVHLGSFSKTIAPGLRVGWAAARRDIAGALTEVRNDLGTSPLLQRVVARFIEDGLFEQHLKTVTNLYRRKRDVMLASLERHCREAATWRTPEGGFFVWLTLGSDNVGEALAAGLKEKVGFLPGPYFAAAPGAFARNLRLSYGETPEPLIEEGVRRLGRALSRGLA